MESRVGIGAALSEIIVRCNWEMEFARAKLETEESGVEVQGLQGEIAGYKKLLTSISAEFKMPQSAIENTGDQPVTLPDLEDDALEVLQESINTLKAHESWAGVLRRIDEDIASMKDYLLYRASKGSEMKIAQGKYRGETSYTQLYAGVEEELKRRAAKAAKQKEEPDLPFDGKEAETEERGLVIPEIGSFKSSRAESPT